MVYLYEDSGHDAKEDLTLPDTPYEHRVCSVTLFCSIAFLATGAYYFIAPSADMKLIVSITAAAFGLALLNFFVAAFRGKLCGCKKS